jgi:hypothetical protein
VFTAVHLKVLKAMLYSPSGRGSKAIAGDVGLGINKTQGIINNLRDWGYIKTVRYRDPMSKTFKARIEMTKDGLYAAALDKVPLGNSSLIDSSYIYKYTEYIGYADTKDKVMTYFEFEEDREEAMRRAREEKRRAREEAQAKKAEEQRMKKRDKADPSKWTLTDTAFEFADQMHKLWHVKPWRVTTSRFRIALAKAQAEFGTNGAIEKVMIDLYFQQIKHNTKINDPEHIWRRFIAQYGSLQIEAERLMITPEDIQRAKEKSMKSRMRLRDV